MQLLKELINDNTTDKNTLHNYLEVYEKLLSPKRSTAKNILEIGIWHGGSVKLWHDYFHNANIHAIDIENIETLVRRTKGEYPTVPNLIPDLINVPGIFLYTSCDAYDDVFFNSNFLDKGDKYDFILDDGSHTIENQQKFITLYTKILAKDGVLIIEDIQEYEHIDVLKNSVPEDLKQYVEVYDLRKTKNRYDDLLFVINKNKVI